jgi:hypothetical protein
MDRSSGGRSSSIDDVSGRKPLMESSGAYGGGGGGGGGSGGRGSPMRGSTTGPGPGSGGGGGAASSAAAAAAAGGSGDTPFMRNLMRKTSITGGKEEFTKNYNNL